LASIALQALDVLHAERIGHGYRVIQDEAAYARCLRQNVHFEVCPASSILTGAVNMQVRTDIKRCCLMMRYARCVASELRASLAGSGGKKSDEIASRKHVLVSSCLARWLHPSETDAHARFLHDAFFLHMSS